MRIFWTLLLVAGTASGQESTKPADPAKSAPPAYAPAAKRTSLTKADISAATDDISALVIPAGTKIPLALKQAISTKNAREGDPVYAEAVFPFVLNDRMLIPAGTYIQGKIMHAEHAGRSKRAAQGDQRQGHHRGSENRVAQKDRKI